MKLSQKIALYFGVFLFLVVVGFMGLNYGIVRQSLRDTAHSNLKRSVESISHATQSMLKSSIRSYLRGVVHQNIVHLESLNEKVKAGNLTIGEAQDAFQEYVRDQKLGNSGYIVAVQKRNKRLFLDIHPYMRGRDCTDTQGCQVWISQKNGYAEYDWQNPRDDSVRKKVAFLQYFEPWDWVVGATSYKDEFTQLISIEDLKKTIKHFRVLERGYFFVLDEKLNMLIHPEFEGQYVGDMRNSDGVYIGREMVKRQDEFYYYRWKTKLDKHDEARFAYVHKIADFSWYLVASGYESDVNRPVKRLERWGYALIATVALILTGLIAMFSRSLTQPLRTLLTGVRDFNLKREVFKSPLRSVAEINQLGLAVEETTQSLLNSEKENRKLLVELKGIINAMPSILVVVDAEAKVEFWNQQAERFSDMSANDASGKSIADVMPAFEKEMPSLVQHIHSRTVFSKICQLESRDAPLRYFEMTTYLLPEELNGTVVRIEEVTERINMEETLLQTRKMDAIGNLAGGIAHDFNNMLTGIIGSVQLLEEHTDESERATLCVQMIHKTALRAAGLTQNLLTFSRKQIRKSEPVRLHTIIDDTVHMLSRSIDKRIEIVTDFTAAEDGLIGDFSEIQSVFLNLGVNASHAMPEGGTLSFHTKLIHISEEDIKTSPALSLGPHILVEVTDTGSGIPAHLIDKVFEPFFTTKEQGKGTGLGLASVYATMMQQKGDVSIRSEEGRGTTVRLRLPLRTLSRPEDDTVSTATTPIRGTGKILVVDDEEMLREISEESLSLLGYSVMLAENGQEAVTLYEQHWKSIDLVMLDMIMPVMGGRECFDELRKINPDVRVVIVSGFSKDNQLAELREKYTFHYLSKPYDIQALSRVIADAMHQ